MSKATKTLDKLEDYEVHEQCVDSPAWPNAIINLSIQSLAKVTRPLRDYSMRMDTYSRCHLHSDNELSDFLQKR